MLYRPAVLPLHATLTNTKLLLVFVLELLSPIITVTVIVSIFYTAGIIVGNTELIIFIGLFTVYPLMVVVHTILLGILVCTTYSILNEKSTRSVIISRFSDRLMVLIKWGILSCIVAPVVRLGLIIGQNQSDINDMGYVGRKAVFYGLQVILLDEDEPPNSMEEWFTRSTSVFQSHFDQVSPETGISIWFRRVSLWAVAIGVLLFFVLHITQYAPAAITTIGFFGLVIIFYLHIKHVAHTLLYHVEETEDTYRNPEDLLTKDVFKKTGLL